MIFMKRHSAKYQQDSRISYLLQALVIILNIGFLLYLVDALCLFDIF